MKTLGCFLLFSASLLAKDSRVVRWEKDVELCSKLVDISKKVQLEKQDYSVLQGLTLATQYCFENLRQVTNELVVEKLITEEQAKKVSIETTTPIELLYPELQGILRRKKLEK